jgi:hypothetical protein
MLGAGTAAVGRGLISPIIRLKKSLVFDSVEGIRLAPNWLSQPLMRTVDILDWQFPFEQNSDKHCLSSVPQ